MEEKQQENFAQVSFVSSLLNSIKKRASKLENNPLVLNRKLESKTHKAKLKISLKSPKK